MRKRLAAGRTLLVPLIGRNAAFGGNGLRGGFGGGGVDLLSRIGEQGRELASELQRSVGRARKSREGARTFRIILRGGFDDGQWQIKVRLRGLRMRVTGFCRGSSRR